MSTATAVAASARRTTARHSVVSTGKRRWRARIFRRPVVDHGGRASLGCRAECRGGVTVPPNSLGWCRFHGSDCAGSSGRVRRGQPGAGSADLARRIGRGCPSPIRVRRRGAAAPATPATPAGAGCCSAQPPSSRTIGFRLVSAGPNDQPIVVVTSDQRVSGTRSDPAPGRFRRRFAASSRPELTTTQPDYAKLSGRAPSLTSTVPAVFRPVDLGGCRARRLRDVLSARRSVPGLCEPFAHLQPTSGRANHFDLDESERNAVPSSRPRAPSAVAARRGRDSVGQARARSAPRDRTTRILHRPSAWRCLIPQPSRNLSETFPSSW